MQLLQVILRLGHVHNGSHVSWDRSQKDKQREKYKERERGGINSLKRVNHKVNIYKYNLNVALTVKKKIIFKPLMLIKRQAA